MGGYWYGSQCNAEPEPFRWTTGKLISLAVPWERYENSGQAKWLQDEKKDCWPTFEEKFSSAETIKKHWSTAEAQRIRVKQYLKTGDYKASRLVTSCVLIEDPFGLCMDHTHLWLRWCREAGFPTWALWELSWDVYQGGKRVLGHSTGGLQVDNDLLVFDAMAWISEGHLATFQPIIRVMHDKESVFTLGHAHNLDGRALEWG